MLVTAQHKSSVIAFACLPLCALQPCLFFDFLLENPAVVFAEVFLLYSK